MNSDAERSTNKVQNYLRKWKNQVIVTGKHGKEMDDSNKVRILEELCRKGADLKHLERERGFACIPRVLWSEKLIRFFIDRGLDVNLSDGRGNTALHLAIRQAYFKNKKRNFYPEKAVKLLLEQSADPSVANLQGETADYAIVRHLLSNTEIERTRTLANTMLINKQAPLVDDEVVPNIINRFVEFKGVRFIFCPVTLLMMAAFNGDLEYCQRLIENGADVNAKDIQGYTALHYAVLNSAGNNYGCAEFLIQKGADPNAKSVSGKEPYDFSIYGYPFTYIISLFTYGATPTKEAEIYEIEGALIIKKKSFWFLGLGDAIKLWDKAMDVYKTHNLPPSHEFVTNYWFLRENLYDSSKEEVIRRLAMNTIARLSEGTNKFWYFVSPSSLLHEIAGSHFFEDLGLLSEELKRVEEFSSYEEDDFERLYILVNMMDEWLETLTELGTKFEATTDRISIFHSIVRLIIACFDKRILVTSSKNVTRTCMNTYVRLCHVLMLLHTRFDEVMAKNMFNDNKRLLRTLIDMDLRDRFGNSMIHRIVNNKEYSFESDLILALLDFEFVKVTRRNLMGFEPVQVMRNWMYEDEDLNVLVKFADRGAHVDARSSLNGQTLKQILEKRKSNLSFKYDSLQCACARILARNIVPYRNRVPKQIVDFINAHMQ